jgi:septin family protein
LRLPTRRPLPAYSSVSVSRARPSASEALAYRLFAAAGANILEQVQEQQREIERLQEEHRQEEERAKRELAQKFRKIQEDEVKLESSTSA